MKANLRKCQRLILITIVSCAFISVSAHASTIPFFLDEKGAVTCDLSKIEKLDPSTWAVVKLGKKADDDFGQFKLTGKKMKFKRNRAWTNMSEDDWTELLETFLGEHFNADISVNNPKFESSTPSHSPIPATVWIFGTGLMTLIMIRRKFRSLIS